jgi:hypothetical protein
VDRGRKPSQESRSAELRRRLVAWKQVPESARPSLRALSRELGTSHQLLGHYLTVLEKRQQMERWHKANEESDSERRPMTQREEQQRHTIATVRADVGPLLRDALANLEQHATRGPLNRLQLKMVKIFAKQ